MYTKDKPLRVLSLFSGIGAFEKALGNIGVPYELVGYSEIDKYAVKSYCTIHAITDALNLGDVTKIKLEELPSSVDIVTFGFPCQPFSQAGHRLGFEDTRGTVIFHVFEIIRTTSPTYFIFENVQGLLTHDSGRTLTTILEVLGNLGYEITMDLLNSKDYGVAQNRLRLFCLGRRINND